MKLYRFIGEKEYNRLLNNETIENHRDWSQYCDTNSKGICFFAYNRTNKLYKIIQNVLDYWGFSGVVKANYLVEVEVDKARKAWGWYAGGRRTEYNLTSYSLNNVNHVYQIIVKDCQDWIAEDGDFWRYEAKVVK